MLSNNQDKKAIREQAHAARRAEPDKDEKSRQICERLWTLPEFINAQVILFYIDVRSEVRTRNYIPKAMALGKKVIVPYCVGDELSLFPLESMEELEIGAFKILEPKKELREKAEKQYDVKNVDLIIVPGVAFDKRGGRMGHGWGYYDKLLHKAKPETPKVALAFECQLFDELPMDPHDIFMDKIITEKEVYDCRAARGLT
ncbi:MAG TPA: 5-formyltetrahydrofolate cyclo-ligase [Candidatus Limnocylindrales bacterium]|nr:5-formyltetrahydrofolate cyclo-ligase [Candidatus Limnocylindrales bacterium]